MKIPEETLQGMRHDRWEKQQFSCNYEGYRVAIRWETTDPHGYVVQVHHGDKQAVFERSIDGKTWFGAWNIIPAIDRVQMEEIGDGFSAAFREREKQMDYSWVYLIGVPLMVGLTIVIVLWETRS